MSDVSYSCEDAAKEVFNENIINDLLCRQTSAEQPVIIQDMPEEEQKVLQSLPVSRIDSSSSIVDDNNEILSRSNLSFSESQSTIQSEEQLDTFERLVFDFIYRWTELRQKDMIEEISKVIGQLGESDLETACAKQKHSLAADENFVYITGGTLPGDEKRFEIFILKLNCIIKGPRMSVHRNSHCSFIQDDYLYAFGGEVLSGSATTMTFERIKLFSHLKNTLKIKSDIEQDVPKALKYADSLASYYQDK